MELFKLFGTIALNNAEANRGIDETSEKAKGASDDVKGLADESEQTEGRMGKVFSKIGSAAAKVGKPLQLDLQQQVQRLLVLERKHLILMQTMNSWSAVLKHCSKTVLTL